MDAPEHAQATPSARTADLTELQLRYAWDWFSYHARQRMSMFGFFLVASGILANAWVQSLKEGYLGTARVIAAAGAVAALVFLLLDWRNRQLVKMGEDLLRELERERLFPGFRPSDGGDAGSAGQITRALLHREHLEEDLARQAPWYNARRIQMGVLRHKVLIAVVEASVLIFFLTAALSG